MGLTAWQISITAFYAGCYLAVGLVIGSLGPTIPPLATALNTTEDELSVVFLARGGGWLASSFAAGVLYDKIPGHPILTIAMLLMGLGPLLVPFAVRHGKTAFLFCFIILGLGGGCVDVGANTLIAWQHGDEVGPHIQFLHFGFAAGGVIAPIIVAQVLGASGLADDNSTSIINGTTSSSSSSSSSSTFSEEDSLFAVDWTYWVLAMFCVPFIIIGLLLKSPARREAESQTGEKAPRTMVIYTSLLLVWYVSAEISYGGWVNSYALNLELATETVAPYLNSVFWGAITLGRLAAVPLSARFSPKQMLIVDVVGATITSVLIAITQPNTNAIWVLSGILGVFLGSVFASAVSYPTSIGLVLSGKDTMWFVIGAAVGEMGLPAALGPIFKSIGYEALPYTVIILCVLQLIFLFLIFRIPGKRAAEKSTVLAQNSIAMITLSQDIEEETEETKMKQPAEGDEEMLIENEEEME